MAPRPICSVTRLIQEPGLEILRSRFEVRGNLEDRALSRDELLETVAGADVILCLLTDTIDGEVLEAAGPRLVCVSNMAVGYDNIDVEAATQRGVLVTNTPGVLTETTADLAWALILAACRRVVEGDRLVREGGFSGWSPTMLVGWDVYGKTLGVVGMGRIGRAVARRAAGFDMKVLYTRAGGELPATERPGDGRWEHRESLEDLLREADIVSLHVPLTEGTEHLIGPRELEFLGQGGILINTARGPVVDEAALVVALREGVIAAAGLDVYEEEPVVHPGLLEADNVVLLPHLGSASRETRNRMSVLAARNAVAAVEGAPVPHPVNPEVLGPAS